MYIHIYTVCVCVKNSTTIKYRVMTYYIRTFIIVVYDA